MSADLQTVLYVVEEYVVGGSRRRLGVLIARYSFRLQEGSHELKTVEREATFIVVHLHWTPSTTISMMTMNCSTGENLWRLEAFEVNKLNTKLLIIYSCHKLGIGFRSSSIRFRLHLHQQQHQRNDETRLSTLPNQAASYSTLESIGHFHFNWTDIISPN